MKRIDLDMFSDKAYAIDPKFKQNLRAQMVAGKPVAKSASVTSAGRRRRVRWPVLVLAPTLAALAVALLIGFNINQPSDIKHPLTPAKVSAAELIARTVAASKDFDYSKYTYFALTSKTTYGPKTDVCSPPGSATATEPITDTTYLYMAPDHGIEAYYGKRVSGYPINPVSVYDDTPQQIVPSYRIPGPSSIDDYIGKVPQGIQPLDYLVDKDGRKVTIDDVPVTQQDGRSVYQFYAKINLSAIDARFPSCETDMITAVTIDAETYQTVSFADYAGSVTPANLAYEMTTNLTYANLSSDEALRRMTAAGFDKAHADPRFPDSGSVSQ